jgi:hypothetical protein
MAYEEEREVGWSGADGLRHASLAWGRPKV